MIRLIDSQRAQALLEPYPLNPQQVKLRLLLDAYGADSGVCDFYEIATGGIACKMGDDLLAYVQIPTVLDEFFAFTRGIGVMRISLVCDFDWQCTTLAGYAVQQGNILRREALAFEHEAMGEIGIADAIELFCDGFETIKAQMEDQQAYEAFYCDLSHRIRHGVIVLSGQVGVCACIRYLAHGDYDILSHICVKHTERGKGIGAKLVYGSMVHKQKACVVYSRDETTDGFYTRLGFRKIGHWYEFSSC